MAALDPLAENLLSISVEQYQELLEHAENLLYTLEKCDYEKIGAYSDKLKQLQAAATLQDQELVPLFEKNPAAWEQHKLYRKRLLCIKSILKLNKVLLPKIRGTMAVTSAELEKMKGGRTALAGYASLSTSIRASRGTG